MSRRRLLIRYDLLLLLCLALGALLVFARFRMLQGTAEDTHVAAVDFRVQGLSEIRAQTLTSAKTLTVGRKNDVTGTVSTKPTYTGTPLEHLREDGTIALLPSGETFDLYGSFQCKGRLGAGGFFANGLHMAAGARYDAQMCGLNVTIEILNIRIFSSN